eukprot:3564238-Pleurochrysis_carterae.AAC.3
MGADMGRMRLCIRHTKHSVTTNLSEPMGRGTSARVRAYFVTLCALVRPSAASHAWLGRAAGAAQRKRLEAAAQPASIRRSSTGGGGDGAQDEPGSGHGHAKGGEVARRKTKYSGVSDEYILSAHAREGKMAMTP